MSKKLKYKAGERLLLEVVVTEVDEHCDDILPYKVMPVNATDDRFVWVNEDELFQQLEAIPAQQSQTIARAQMVCTLLAPLSKEGCYPLSAIFEAINSVDIIISELNKNSK